MSPDEFAKDHAPIAKSRHAFCGQDHSIGTPCPDNGTVRSRYLDGATSPMTMQDNDFKKELRQPTPDNRQHSIADVPNRRTRRMISKKRGYFGTDKRGAFRMNSDHFGVRQPKNKGGFSNE